MRLIPIENTHNFNHQGSLHAAEELTYLDWKAKAIMEDVGGTVSDRVKYLVKRLQRAARDLDRAMDQEARTQARLTERKAKRYKAVVVKYDKFDGLKSNQRTMLPGCYKTKEAAMRAGAREASVRISRLRGLSHSWYKSEVEAFFKK